MLLTKVVLRTPQVCCRQYPPSLLPTSHTCAVPTMDSKHNLILYRYGVTRHAQLSVGTCIVGITNCTIIIPFVSEQTFRPVIQPNNFNMPRVQSSDALPSSHGVTRVQKCPLWHVLLDKRLVHWVGVIQCHVVQPKDQLWRPIVKTALPPQIVIRSHPIPLVNQMKCIAVVPSLPCARHFHLRPLPLPIAVPFLLQHPHSRLKYLRAVEL